MTRLRFLACSFALAASASSALAADLPSRYAPAPYYDAAPIFTWGGVYAGINGQLGVGSFTQGGNQVFGSPLGGLGGATLGYNYQQGRLLVGVEADAEFGSISGQGNFGRATSGSGVMNGLGTIRARVGYIFNQRLLIYATGGYAAPSLTARSRTTPFRPTTCSTRAITSTATPSVPASIRADHQDLGQGRVPLLHHGFGAHQYFSGTRDSVASGANISLIRAGVNYHF